MKNIKNQLNLEHFILFVLFPFSLVFEYSIYIKLALGFFAVAYVVYISFKNGYFKNQKQYLSKSEKALFYKHLAVKFSIIILLTSVITIVFYNKELFNAFQNDVAKFFTIIGIYIFLSVIPQEFIYRKFYFLRYQPIFKSDTQLIVINTLVFCLGHLFFNNLLVLAITLIGGLIFSLSYKKFQSFRLICLEHSLYGLWLYIIGLGGLLGFPVG